MGLTRGGGNSTECEIKRLEREKGGNKKKKKRGTWETQGEWICISFGMGQGTNELPHRLPLLTHRPFTLLCPSCTEWGDVRGQGGPDTQEAQCKQQALTLRQTGPCVFV